LANAPDGSIDLLIIDAFSSDAIPIHLMTREAVALYRSKLSVRGSVVFHISNRNMELASVVAAIGEVNGLAVFRGAPQDKANLAQYITDSEVAVLSPSVDDVGDLPQRPGWQRYEVVPGIKPWTDDYADVTGAIWRRLRSH
jgi:hypothetical protein